MSRLPRGLVSQLFPRCFSSGILSSCLLSSCHRKFFLFTFFKLFIFLSPTALLSCKIWSVIKAENLLWEYGVLKLFFINKLD